MKARINWIVSRLNKTPILDVGFCGSDNEPDVLFKTIRSKTNEVIGIDIDIRKTKLLNEPKTFVADGLNMPFKNNSFYTVVIGEVIEHLWNCRDLLQETYRVLKPGGSLIVTTPNSFSPLRLIKYFFFATAPTSRKNVSDYLAFHDHKMFYDPLSLANVLYDTKFTHVSYQALHQDLPYLPLKIRETEFNHWPFNRIGVYSCFEAVK